MTALRLTTVCASGLYGPGQVFYSPCDHTDYNQLETVFLRALDTLGEIRLIVHSSAGEPLRVEKEDVRGDISSVDRRLDRFLMRRDVEGLRRVSQLASKYMGQQHGWQGGTLLNISSSTELAAGRTDPGDCTVLGTTRALGLASKVRSFSLSSLDMMIYLHTILRCLSIN